MALMNIFNFAFPANQAYQHHSQVLTQYLIHSQWIPYIIASKQRAALQLRGGNGHMRMRPIISINTAILEATDLIKQ